MDWKIIEDLASLLALAQAWGDMDDAIQYPFQELGWYMAWAGTVGAVGAGRLKCITLWDANRLIAVLPLVLRRYKGIRLLEWMGVRVTDYCDVIVAPGVDARDALRRLWWVLNHKIRFDVLRLGHVRSDAVVGTFVDQFHPWVETQENAYSIPLTWSSGADWLASRSSHKRGQARQRLRSMEKNGFEFKVWRTLEPDVLEAAIEQKIAWAKARNAHGVLTGPHARDLLRTLAKEMSARGLLHLSAIRSRDHIAACHLGFVHGDTFYYYMPTYDAAFGKQSFGTTLRDLLIMWACDQRLKKFDMLLGAEEYKLNYDAVEQPVRTLVVPRGPIGRAAVAYYRYAAARAAHGKIPPKAA